MFWAGILSFFQLRWKAILVICVCLGIGLLVWQWRSDIQARVRAVVGYEQMAQVVKQQNKAIKELHQEYRRVKEINKKYSARIEKIRDEMQGTYHEIEKVLQRSKEATNWADNPLPDAVLARLRNRSPKGGEAD